MIEFTKEDFNIKVTEEDKLIENCNDLMNQVDWLASNGLGHKFGEEQVDEASYKLYEIIQYYNNKINYLENQLSLLKEENQKLNTRLNKVIDAIYK